jgi:hypothetical protein
MNSIPCIPERSYLDRQIHRALTRMLEAKQDCWAYRWADLACRLMKRRNAPASFAIQKPGLRRVASRGVVTTSDKHPTTPVVVMEETT